MEFDEAPFLGEYVRHVKTGEIFKLRSSNSRTKTLEIQLSNGGVSTVPRPKYERISANEELEYLSQLKKER